MDSARVLQGLCKVFTTGFYKAFWKGFKMVLEDVYEVVTRFFFFLEDA